jgi:hypothetical protein
MIAVNVSSIAGFLGFYVPFMYLPNLVASRDGITGRNLTNVPKRYCDARFSTLFFS